MTMWTLRLLPIFMLALIVFWTCNASAQDPTNYITAYPAISVFQCGGSPYNITTQAWQVAACTYVIKYSIYGRPGISDFGFSLEPQPGRSFSVSGCSNDAWSTSGGNGNACTTNGPYAGWESSGTLIKIDETEGCDQAAVFYVRATLTRLVTDGTGTLGLKAATSCWTCDQVPYALASVDTCAQPSPLASTSASPSRSATPSPSRSASPSPSQQPSPSASTSPSASSLPSVSATPSPSASTSVLPSVSGSASPLPSSSTSLTPSPSASAPPSPSASASNTASPSPSVSILLSPSASSSSSPSSSPSASASASALPSSSVSAPPSSSAFPSLPSSPSLTPSRQPSPSASVLPSPSSSHSPPLLSTPQPFGPVPCPPNSLIEAYQPGLGRFSAVLFGSSTEEATLDMLSGDFEAGAAVHGSVSLRNFGINQGVACDRQQANAFGFIVEGPGRFDYVNGQLFCGNLLTSQDTQIVSLPTFLNGGGAVVSDVEMASGFNFDRVSASLRDLSASLCSAHSLPAEVTPWGAITLKSSEQAFEAYTLQAEILTGATYMSLTGFDLTVVDQVVVNVVGNQTLAFSGFGIEVGQVPLNSIIWNICDADLVTIQAFQLPGILLAPRSDVILQNALVVGQIDALTLRGSGGGQINIPYCP